MFTLNHRFRDTSLLRLRLACADCIRHRQVVVPQEPRTTCAADDRGTRCARRCDAEEHRIHRFEIQSVMMTGGADTAKRRTMPHASWRKGTTTVKSDTNVAGLVDQGEWLQTRPGERCLVRVQAAGTNGACSFVEIVSQQATPRRCTFIRMRTTAQPDNP